MSKAQEYAAQRRCMRCDESCDGAKMHFHHNDMQECIRNLQRERDAANGRAQRYLEMKQEFEKAYAQAEAERNAQGLTLATLCDMLDLPAPARSDDALVRAVGMLKRERDEDAALRGRMGKILEDAANALHGAPLENGLWSWHDLPKLAQQVKAERDAAKMATKTLDSERTMMRVAMFGGKAEYIKTLQERAEQAEAELVEAQSRLIAGAVYEKLDSINYWKTRAEQAEADARALAEFASISAIVEDVEYGAAKMERVAALITKYLGGAK